MLRNETCCGAVHCFVEGVSGVRASPEYLRPTPLKKKSSISGVEGTSVRRVAEPREPPVDILLTEVFLLLTEILIIAHENTSRRCICAAVDLMTWRIPS